MQDLQSHTPPPPIHIHLCLMGADIALWIGWGQRACDKQMFSCIGILGQVGLVKEGEREREDIWQPALDERSAYRSALGEFSCQHLQTLHDNQPSNYSIGGGNDRDNVPCHG